MRNDANEDSTLMGQSGLMDALDASDPGPMPGDDSSESGESPALVIIIARAQLFPLGRLVATPGALAALSESSKNPLDYVRQHATGEWGNLSDEDASYNWQALKTEGRLLSSYRLPDGQEIWLITEADRSATTLLLPEDY